MVYIYGIIVIALIAGGIYFGWQSHMMDQKWKVIDRELYFANQILGKQRQLEKSMGWIPGKPWPLADPTREQARLRGQKKLSLN